MSLESVYALSKYDQERMTLLLGRAYGIPTVALRFFNVFGPRQALSNPYTGVLAIFASRLLNGAAPLIFEDGLQRRDFVSVYDVARACALALDSDRAVGPGDQHRQRALVHRARDRGEDGGGHGSRRAWSPEITGKYRMGDVRHCFADIGRARELLGYQPEVPFETRARRAGHVAAAARSPTIG